MSRTPMEKQRFSRVKKEKPGPGQESVWDYPRPPKLESSSDVLKITLAGETIAETNRSFRVLETSHPPVYYLPQSDIRMELLSQTSRKTTFCEWKGMAVYWDIVVGNKSLTAAAWSYPMPNPAFAPITDYIAFYPSLMGCLFREQ